MTEHGEDPLRWVDDDDADPELRALLGAAPPAPALSDATRASLAAAAAGLSVGGTRAAAAASIATWKIGVLLLAAGGGIASVGWVATRGEQTHEARESEVAAATVGESSNRELDPEEPVEPSIVEPPTNTEPSDDRPTLAEPASDLERVDDPAAGIRVRPRTREPNAAEAHAGRPSPRSNTSTSAAGASSDRGGAAGESIAGAFADQPVQPASSTLQEEASILEQARAALGERDEQALRYTQQHRARFPDGQLASEREFISVRALISLGRSVEARRRARVWLGAHPGALYNPQIQALLDGL